MAFHADMDASKSEFKEVPQMGKQQREEWEYKMLQEHMSRLQSERGPSAK